MNNLPDSPMAERLKPALITAEEFDAKFDAGEDISEYIDWSSATLVRPGELSPGQKESLLAMFSELAAADKLMITQVMLDAIADADLHLSVPIPATLYPVLAQMALQRQMSREALVQSWIVPHLQEQKAVA